MIIQGDKSESQSHRAGEKGMLCTAQHGRTDARAVQAVDVIHGECAKVQGAPTAVCVRCSCTAL